MTKTSSDTLIEAAAILLDGGGPAAVTLRAVGDAAGVSRGAPYRHFEGKTQLLAAVASRELDRLTGIFNRGKDPAGDLAVEAAMVAYLKWALRYPERFRLTFGRWETEDRGLGAATGRTRQIFIQAVSRAQRSGELPVGDPHRLGTLLLCAVHGIADLALAGHLSPGRTGRADARALVADLFAHLRTAASALAPLEPAE